MEWFYALHREQLGPIDEAKLDELIRLGIVKNDTMVWNSTLPDWQTLDRARPVAPSQKTPDKK